MLNLPHYHIDSYLYESAFSIICRAFHKQDRRSVVLKIMKKEYPDLSDLASFRQEYEISQQLQSNAAVKTIALEKHKNRLMIIMEDCAAQSLNQVLQSQQERRLSLSQFIPLAVKITECLGNLHAVNIIHKDINPSNIIWNQATQELKIIDFGIASQLSLEKMTLINPKNLEGSLAYMSPEQTGRMNRSLDYRSDIYSLGVTFYELLTGKLPYEASSPMQMVHSHIAKTALPVSDINPQIPAIVAAIISKMMAKNVEERYQSAFGIKADLEKCLNYQDDLSFALGSEDLSAKFLIPQKLYGRDNELRRLLQAFERIGQGRAEMMLVAGYSGVGKTALVHEVHKPMSQKNGNFAAGKFEQYQRNIPYSALSQAFNELCNYLLTESVDELAYWREKILQAVADNGKVLIDVIPQLELIIGPQAPVLEVGGQESQNRFNLIFKNFFQSLCQETHPLVLFIDDLQWADSASLSLLKLLMTEENNRYFLIIGAYRDNEVDATHPLMLMKDDLEKSSAVLNLVQLQNLSKTDVRQLISDTLLNKVTPADSCKQKNSAQSDSQLTQSLHELTSLIYAKTHGNAFFTHGFLSSLYENDLLSYSQTEQQWQWNIQDIHKKAMTDNVVRLMANKIEQYALETQMVLKLAACIGNQFDLVTLAIISKQSTAEVLAKLWPAIAGGLLMPMDDNYKQLESLVNKSITAVFKFQHDRIQQAAYWLIAEDEKISVHLKIGQLLIANTEILEERIFEVVDHMNIGRPLIVSDEHRNELARLNLTAAQQAKKAAAYHAAIKYLTYAQACLSKDHWHSDYHLCLEIWVEKAEAEYLNTNYIQAQHLIQEVLKNAKSLLEKVKVYDIQMQMYIAQNQMQDAIDNGLEVLSLLQVELSHSPPKSLSMTEFYQLAPMTDVNKQAAMSILMTLFAPSVIANPKLLAPIAYTMVDLCIKHGNSRASAFSYGFYGTLLCGVLGDIELGYQFGQLSRQVLQRYQAKETQSRVENLYNAFIVHWKEHPQVAIEPLRDAVHVGLQVGDIEFACYNAVNYIFTLFLSGELLDTVSEKQQPYLNLIQSLKQEFQLYYAKIWAQLIDNLRANTEDKFLLNGEFFNESEILPRLQKNNNFTSLFCTYLAKCILCYYFKNYPQAIYYAELAEQNESAMVGLLPVGQRPFYQSLALLANYSQVSTEEQKVYLQQVNANQEKIQTWAKHAEMNYQHKYDLESVMKASEIIVGEVVLSRLLEKVMAVIIENAGAQQGALLLLEGETWLIEAQGSIDNEEVMVLQSLPLAGHLPETIVSYVTRSRQNVVLANACEERRYAEDDYIKSQQTQSLLCFPILYQQQLRAILYLENNHVTGAFNSERLAILQLLSSQVAIALENALLYRTLEQKVASRTEQLSRSMLDLKNTQKQLVESEKMASLGNLVAGVAHEINTPLGISYMAASFLKEEVEKYQKIYQGGEITAATMDEFFESLSESSDIALNNLERSAKLIKNFKLLAVEQSEEKRNTFNLKRYLQDILLNLCPTLDQSLYATEVLGDENLTINSYPGIFSLIVSNLVSNSIQHAYESAPTGKILIQFQLQEDTLVLRYEDDGIGMSRDVLEKIFEPFYTTERASGAVGLGLHIVYNLVTQKLKGEISAQSKLGHGTVFTLNLPLLCGV